MCKTVYKEENNVIFVPIYYWESTWMKMDLLVEKLHGFLIIFVSNCMILSLSGGLWFSPVFLVNIVVGWYKSIKVLPFDKRSSSWLLLLHSFFTEIWTLHVLGIMILGSMVGLQLRSWYPNLLLLRSIYPRH